MDVYDSPYRDAPDDGVGLLGRALALIALGAVLTEAWRTLRATHERRLATIGAGADGEAPDRAGDAFDRGPTGSATGRRAGRTTLGGVVASPRSAGTGLPGAAGRDDDVVGPDLPPTGVIPTTHH